MIRRWIGLAMCTALGACTQIEEMAMPVADKVNAAYPVAGEVRLAQDRLHTKLAAEAKALEAAKAQFASRMSLRALSCTQHRSIGRLDSVATVRAMALPATCFQEQDQALQQFLGARLIGALMAGPPLRPLQPLGPFVRLPSAGMAHVYAATFAPEAGVALLRGPRGEHVAVQVPGGAQIAVLPQLAPTGFEARLSHNGRVVAFSTQGQGLVFVETETGSRILELPQAGSFVAWLAEVGGFVHAGTQGKLMLVDTATGASGPHPLALGNASWGLQLPGKASQLLLGNGRHIELISHERQTDGIRAVSIKQYPLAEGLSVSSRSPVPMLQGKRLVFQSMLDIGWLDLESGQSGAWKVAPPLEMPFAKIDETHLYLVSVARDRLTTQAWSFDIAAETVAPIDLAGIAVGALLPIGERAGVLRRSNEAWLGDAMPAGAPVSTRCSSKWPSSSPSCSRNCRHRYRHRLRHRSRRRAVRSRQRKRNFKPACARKGTRLAAARRGSAGAMPVLRLCRSRPPQGLPMRHATLRCTSWVSTKANPWGPGRPICRAP